MAAVGRKAGALLIGLLAATDITLVALLLWNPNAMVATTAAAMAKQVTAVERG
jgi:hypothetical protein